MTAMIRIVILFTIFISQGVTSQVMAQIKWLSWDEALSKHKTEPRKLIVDVYTQWCGWCKKMDKATFGQTDISTYINQNYYPIKFDAETKNDIVFKNKVFKYVRQGHSGYHQLAAEITFGNLSYPTIVFLDENLNVIQPIPGYKDPNAMDKIMKYFAEDYYKTTPWKKYELMCQPKTAQPQTVPIKRD